MTSRMSRLLMAITLLCMLHVVTSQGVWVEDERTQKSYLVLNTTTLDHDVAQNKCQQYGGILPEPRSQQENDFLWGLGTEMFLLGMNDIVTEGAWVLDSDGSEVIFTNWGPGEPGHEDGLLGIQEDCAIMTKNFLTGADKWADQPCSPLGNIMEREKKSLICQRGCDDGSFGKDCKFICNCAEETELCDKITGICPKSGCKTGFSEESGCRQGCNNNSFGKDCKFVCNCAEETEVCDKITGICPKSGCKTGFSEESGCQDRSLLWWAIVTSSAILSAAILFSISYWLYIKHKNKRKIKSIGSLQPTETETSQTQSTRSGESGTLTGSTVTSDSMSTGRESESLSHSGKTDFLSWWNTPTSKLTEKPTSII